MSVDEGFIDNSYYGLTPGEIKTVDRPLPGYRVEVITADGRIGSYADDGHTPVAHCDLRYRYHARTLWDMAKMISYMANNPALTHDPTCEHCGHRIVRSLSELADFIALVGESKERENSFMNYEHPKFRTGYVAFVECAVPAGGTIGDRSRRNSELAGTIRADRLQLGKTVILPRYFGKRDQRPAARLIRRRYGVTVKMPDMDEMTYINGYMS